MRAHAIALLCFAAVLPVQAATSTADANRVLNRIAYGPAPGDLEHVKAIGIDAYIDEQLAPEKLAEPAALTQQLAGYDSLQESPAALFRQYGNPAIKALREASDDPEKQKAAVQALRKEANVVPEQAQNARLLRAVESPRQLEQLMTEFWFDHFNVYAGKGVDRIWVGTYERDAIRPYVLGHFRDLLEATAKHPAMLFYLDNWRSTYDGFQPRGSGGLFAPKPKAGPSGLNENYAREVMELHTLGVDGGYTQKDVTELARILTGWTYDPRAMADGDDQAGFVFAPRRHDTDSKFFLGEKIGDNGVAEGEEALDMLAGSPATAHHIAYELTQFFIADEPPAALVDKVAAKFRASDGDIRETLRTLLHDRALLDPRNTKFKTPYQYVVSALRASGLPVANPRPALQALRQMGQPVYGCPTPDGYKNTEAAWLNPNALLLRVNFASALGAGMPRLSHGADAADADPVEATAAVDAMTPPAGGMMESHLRRLAPDESNLLATLGLELSASTAQAINAAEPPLRAGLLLGSPEFMRR
jgi:uncharacterized protein (DUF1800 family)